MQPLRGLFTDQELDPSTGLYNYDARFYDPVIGRFISPDSIIVDYYDPQTLNRYSYCRNNPLTYVDPSGHQGEESDEDDGWFSGIWGAIESAKDAIGKALSDAKNAIGEAFGIDPGGLVPPSPPISPSTPIPTEVEEVIKILTPKNYQGIVTPEEKKALEESKKAAAAAAAAGLVTGKLKKKGDEDPALPDSYWEDKKAPTQVPPGTRRTTEMKPSSRKQGEVYERTTHYDEYGRSVGQTHKTDHGELDVHPNPHHHTRDPITGEESGPLPGEHPEY